MVVSTPLIPGGLARDDDPSSSCFQAAPYRYRSIGGRQFSLTEHCEAYLFRFQGVFEVQLIADALEASLNIPISNEGRIDMLRPSGGWSRRCMLS